MEAQRGLSVGRHHQGCRVQFRTIAGNCIIAMSPENLPLSSCTPRPLKVLQSAAVSLRSSALEIKPGGGSAGARGKTGGQRPCPWFFQKMWSVNCVLLQGLSAGFLGSSPCVRALREIILQQKKYMLITPSHFLWKLNPSFAEI